MSNDVGVVRIEDAGGTGQCGCCNREGLRWVAVMSDGSFLGTACAKKSVGFVIVSKDVDRLRGFTVVAERRNKFGNGVYVLWHSESLGTYAETFNGKVRRPLGLDIARQWEKDGWIDAAVL